MQISNHAQPGLTLLALGFWFSVREICGMLGEKKDLAAKSRCVRSYNPGQGRRKSTVTGWASGGILVGSFHFNPLGSMQKSHLAEPREVERC